MNWPLRPRCCPLLELIELANLIAAFLADNTVLETTPADAVLVIADTGTETVAAAASA